MAKRRVIFYYVYGRIDNVARVVNTVLIIITIELRRVVHGADEVQWTVHSRLKLQHVEHAVKYHRVKEFVSKYTFYYLRLLSESPFSGLPVVAVSGFVLALSAPYSGQV